MTALPRSLLSSLALAGLLGAALPAPTQDPGADQDAQAARVVALVERFDQAQSAFWERLAEADSEQERTRLFQEENPLGAFVDEFRALALELGESDAAVTAWLRVVDLGPDNGRLEPAREALQRLVAHHVQSPRMLQLAMQLRWGSYSIGRANALEALRTIHGKTELADVKITAQFVLATVLLQAPSDEERAEARSLLAELAEGAGDVEGAQFADRAAATLYELERLQIGMVAPDFEAVDQDGVAWKLSDYRGKVVVLDFWGFW